MKIEWLNRHKFLIAAAGGAALLCLYFFHLIYLLCLIHVFPVKPIADDVLIEFNHTWVPVASTESFMWGADKGNQPPIVTFFKINGAIPLHAGRMAILRFSDEDGRYSTSNKIYSEIVPFSWGSAYVIKKDFTSNKDTVFAVVPEHHLLINTETLEQLSEIKSISKTAKSGS